MSTNSLTLRSAVLPKSMPLVGLVDAALIALGTAFISLSGLLAFHVPWTPVPVTAQTFAVLTVGAALGSWRGLSSMALYLGLGVVGVPVFAGHSSGMHVLWGGTGGYLVGMLLAALLVGALAERRWDRNVRSAVPQMLLGDLLVFGIGVPWLAVAAHLSAGQAIAFGLTPFVLVELIKLVAAGLVLPGAWRLADLVRR